MPQQQCSWAAGASRVSLTWGRQPQSQTYRTPKVTPSRSNFVVNSIVLTDVSAMSFLSKCSNLLRLARDGVAFVVEDRPDLVERDRRWVVIEEDLPGRDVDPHGGDAGLVFEGSLDRVLAMLARNVGYVENNLSHNTTSRYQLVVVVWMSRMVGGMWRFGRSVGHRRVMGFVAARTGRHRAFRDIHYPQHRHASAPSEA